MEFAARLCSRDLNSKVERLNRRFSSGNGHEFGHMLHGALMNFEVVSCAYPAYVTNGILAVDPEKFSCQDQIDQIDQMPLSC